MNRRQTAYRIDDLVLCGIDDDDLVLSAERHIHERLGESCLRSERQDHQSRPEVPPVSIGQLA